jgi:hypothetical protein
MYGHAGGDGTTLLIAPEGIEITLITAFRVVFWALLIAPEGIEITK